MHSCKWTVDSYAWKENKDMKFDVKYISFTKYMKYGT